MIRHMKALVAALVLALAPLPVLAQQVANHAIPIGKGPGVIGFGAVPAAANTKFLVGGGTSADPVMQTMSGDCTLVAGVVTCAKANGVTMPSSGTSGGIPYYSSTSAISSSSVLTANQLVIGGGAGVAPAALGSLGTTTTVLHGNASGAPSYGAVAIGSDVSGLGTNVATFLATPSSANAAAALTDETGAGAMVFGTTPTLAGTPNISQALAVTGDTSPSQITSSQNDYAPANFSTSTILRLNSDASRNITGLAGGSDGLVKIIANVGSNNIVLTNQDAASTAANRFAFGGDVTLAADSSLAIQYDATSSRWRAITSAGSGGGGGGSGTVTSAAIAAGTGIQTSGTCTITTSGTCTVSEADQYRQNDLLMCANQAKALAAYQRILETFCDGYKASDGVSGGAPTNGTVNTSSGYVGPTSSTTTTVSGSDPPATAAAGGWNGTTWVNESTALPNSVTITKIGMYADNAVTLTMKIVKRNSSSSVDVVVSQAFSHPGGGWADLTLSSPYAVPGTGTYYVGAYVSNNISFKYNASATRLTAASDITGNGQTVTEAATSAAPSFRASQATVYNNMTMVTTAQTADTTVGNGRVLMEIDPIDSITLNTDLTAEVTCNGGTNYATGTLSSAGKGQGGRTVVETADTTCGANTGTSFAARIKTLNNKNVNVYKTTLTVH